MIELIIFILACLGITNIIVREYVFKWFRNIIGKIFPYSLLNKMINCEICLGFWIGLILVLMAPNFILIPSVCLLLKCVVGGSISSVANKIVFTLLYKF